jgi:uncharacterized protein YjdB
MRFIRTTLIATVIFLFLFSCQNSLSSNDNVEISNVSLNIDTLRIVVGGTNQLSATVTPDNATNKNVTWTSSDENVATVSTTGLVKGLMVGTATVTVATIDGNKTASCIVTVSPVSVTAVTLSKNASSILVGGTDQLFATVTPDTAADKNVSWTSLDANVATVSTTGLVTGVTIGTATITVTTVDGNRTASCIVTVSPVSVTGLALNKNTSSIFVGATDQLIATIIPSTATNKNITWTSSDSTIATVSTIGMVTGIKIGSANITATSVDGNKTASCAVAVNPILVSGISVSPSSKKMMVGDTCQITANITPSNATNGSVNWTSSDASIVSIDANGKATGNRIGAANITATTVDQGISSSCSVTITTIDNIVTNQFSYSMFRINNSATISLGVTFVNSSSKDVNIDRITIMNGGTIIEQSTDQTLLGPCAAGSSNGVSTGAFSTILPSIFTANWYFTYDGMSYVLTRSLTIN